MLVVELTVSVMLKNISITPRGRCRLLERVGSILTFLKFSRKHRIMLQGQSNNYDNVNVFFLEEAYCRSQKDSKESRLPEGPHTSALFTSDIALSVINASRRATILVDLSALCVFSNVLFKNMGSYTFNIAVFYIW